MRRAVQTPAAFYRHARTVPKTGLVETECADRTGLSTTICPYEDHQCDTHDDRDESQIRDEPRDDQVHLPCRDHECDQRDAEHAEKALLRHDETRDAVNYDAAPLAYRPAFGNRGRRDRRRCRGDRRAVASWGIARRGLALGLVSGVGRPVLPRKTRDRSRGEHGEMLPTSINPAFAC
jgi:hypothetical protein